MNMLLVFLFLGEGCFPYAFWLGDRIAGVNAAMDLAGAAWLVGLACALALILLQRRGKWSARRLVLGNMAVKLAQIPVYILWFCMGVGLFLFGGWAMAFLFDVMAIVLSGIGGLAAVFQCRREDILSRPQAVFYGVLQFLFCVDVISAIMLYRKTKEVSP